jgi:Kef-type K+ transport system membrane component KefB
VRKVLLYSLLLIGGLVASQFLGAAPHSIALAIKLLTMAALAFIMIHVGYEFEIDKARPGQYAWDFFVAMTAASLPWIFCGIYFALAMAPRGLWSHPDLWKEAMLEGLFAAPTSAGVLFSMLAAAGLAATWLFRKARILAIFDDLGTLLLIIPLKIMFLGARWQLAVVIFVMVGLLWVSWKYLHRARMPISWPWVLSYAAGITLICGLIEFASERVDPDLPIHIEVLLPAFAVGCIMGRPRGADPHQDDARENIEEGPEDPQEQRVSTIISAAFMLLVGLSMPSILGGSGTSPGHGALEFAGAPQELVEAKRAFPGWSMIAFHVIVITVLSNLGKMVPAFCYRREASFRERLGLAIGMWPRGEVGAGVLVIAVTYGLSGPTLTVAVLSLSLNLLCTGLFIVIVKKLIAAQPAAVEEAVAAA